MMGTPWRDPDSAPNICGMWAIYSMDFMLIKELLLLSEVFTIVRIKYGLVALRDIIIQSLSSKVIKQLLLSKFGAESQLSKLISDNSPLARAPEKPIKMSMIYRGERALWNEGKGVPLILRRGEEYYFYITFIDSPKNAARLGIDDGNALGELMELDGNFRIYGYGEVTVKLSGVEMIASNELGSEEAWSSVKLEFPVPVLLQYPKPARLRLRESVNALYPLPQLVIWNMVWRWSMYGDDHLSPSLPQYAPLELREIDHRIHAITINMGVKERGFTGWIIYRLTSKNKERAADYVKLLRFASLTGIGRSTTLGLGQVKLYPLNKEE
jgi:CRISPR-associated endoribonuclease Cas6